LFKVAADFEEAVPWTPENVPLFARFLGTLARRDGLRPLERGGVARTLEESARLAEDSQKLSVHAENLADLLREADHAAARAGRRTIAAEDVALAVEAAWRRTARVRDRVQEQIRRGTLLIDTRGAVAGQVNGLSVLSLGPFTCGHPSRITARVRVGSGQVVDIEREVELGGPIHSKGVLILAGFLGARYSPERPLSLQASLVFEQSYAGVEGDSASLAELLVVLSALADVPLRQAIAVTGSVNQLGRVQPVGGVNDKIEGFFDTCRARGLTGAEGVVIPTANVANLMLRPDVVEAVAHGLFRVWPVETVDEAIEILTGVPAGARDAQQRFPEASVNQRVEARLAAFAEQARAHARAAGPPEGGRP
ncbi:MAG TPA: Lon-insertion domain-containing protein, partial [Candidatus Dormibacteraeota bacterium]|nr:Lon-insertion domain-containing protein [Candidatus Dormibacteraeota bacterium]